MALPEAIIAFPPVEETFPGWPLEGRRSNLNWGGGMGYTSLLRNKGRRNAVPVAEMFHVLRRRNGFWRGGCEVGGSPP